MFFKKEKLIDKIKKAYQNARIRAYLKASMVYPIDECKPLDEKRLKEQFDFQLRLENKFILKVARKFKVTKQELIEIIHGK